MPYTHTTWAQLKTILSRRLGDTSKIFWVDTELGLYLAEALRTFGVLSGFWRDRGTVSLVSGTAFYDLTTTLSGSLLTSTITDRDMIEQIQYALLEATSTQASWPGTSQFTYDDVVNAITQTRDQFLADTGIICTRSTQVVGTLTGRQTLSQSIIDVRRAAWVGIAPLNYYSLLWREDERALALANASWSASTGTPTAYSVMAPPPLEVQLAPPPVVTGTLDMITVNVGPALAPASGATALGIPDDLTPAIKWGALSYLLSTDGQARDSGRATFAQARYDQFVQLARLLSCVVNIEISGVSKIPETLYGLDAGVPNWQNTSGTTTVIGLAGWNLIGAYPVPNATATVTFDVVRKAPVPTSGATAVQIGQEQLDMLVEYAVNLALFKVGGYELSATQKMADDFLIQAMTYNQRLAASARYIVVAKEASQREKDYRARLQKAEALGALPSAQDAQSFQKPAAPSRIRNTG